MLVTLTFLLKQIEGLHERTEHLDIFFPPITQWCSIYWWKGSVRF